MQFHRQSLASERQCAVIGRGFARSKPKKSAQRAAVFAAPSDPALRGDVFEVADEDHPEVDSRWESFASRLLVERLGRLFKLTVKVDVGQQLVEPIIKRIPRPRAEFIGGNPE